jgi:hypothetical protein
MRLKDPTLKCQWIDRDLKCQFTWKDKRGAMMIVGDSLMLDALPGSASTVSTHYESGKSLASSTKFGLDRMYLDALPDPIDLTPPRTDDLRSPDGDE